MVLSELYLFLLEFMIGLLLVIKVAYLVKNPLQCRRPGFDPWVGKIPWRKEKLPTLVFWPGEFHGLCSPWGRKELYKTEWLSLSLLFLCFLVLVVVIVFAFFFFFCFFSHYRHWCGEGNGTPLQYSCLENPMDGGAWWATVHGVAESRTRLSDFTFTFHFPALEKEMATHSSVLAWRIPGTGEPGGLPSMGSHRVGHNWSDLAAAA